MSAQVHNPKAQRSSVIQIHQMTDENQNQNDLSDLNLKVEYFNPSKPQCEQPLILTETFLCQKVLKIFNNKSMKKLQKIHQKCEIIKDKLLLDDNIDFPIYTTQEGRIMSRKVRAQSKKKSSNIPQENKQQARQLDLMKKQSKEMQLQDLRKQQKRERLIFETVIENYAQKENEKLAQFKEFSSHQNEINSISLTKQESQKGSISLQSQQSIHNHNNQQENYQEQNFIIEDVSPIETKHYDKVEDLRNFKFENISIQNDIPLLTHKKYIPPKTAQSQRAMIPEGINQQGNSNLKKQQHNLSYEQNLNKVSQIYNIPLYSVNTPGLIKNKKKNHLLIKMTPNNDGPSRPQTSKTNNTLNTSDISSNITNINIVPQKSPTVTQKTPEPMRIVRKLPGSSSQNNIPVNNSKQSSVLQSTQRSNNVSSYGSYQRFQQMKTTKSPSLPVNSAQTPTSQNSAGSLIKLLQKDKSMNFISIDTPKKQYQQYISKGKGNFSNSNQKDTLNSQTYQNNLTTDMLLADAELPQIGLQKENQIQDFTKYNSIHTNNIIFSHNQEENNSIKFNSQTNLDEELIDEDISQIEAPDNNSTSSSNTIQLLINNQQANLFLKKKEEDKTSIHKHLQFYGTIREDENEDFDQTPMNGNNIFKRLDKKKRDELDRQIREEILEESQGHDKNDKGSNSQDSTPQEFSESNAQNKETYQNQANLLIRPVRSRFQRMSPVATPKRGKRGRSVNSENGSVADQSFSAQNGVFEESMSMDSSMSSEFQFQGGIVNCLQSNQKEQLSQPLSQNILDDLQFIEEQKTETDEIRRSTLTKDNLEKLVQQSLVSVQQQQIEEEEQQKQLQDYSKMNHIEKIAEINKIQKEVEEEKKRVEQEKQKIFLQQMELERQRLLYNQCSDKIQKEKQNLINMKSDYEKLKIQLNKNYSCKNREEEEQFQQYHSYLKKKQAQLEKDIMNKQDQFQILEKQLVDIHEQENKILKEIQFLCNVLNYDISNLNIPQLNKTNYQFGDQGCNSPQPPTIFQKKPSFIRQSDKKLENVVSPKQKFIVNNNQSQHQSGSSRCTSSFSNISRDQQDVLKEGWLFKKSPSMFKGWKEQQKKRIRGCINLKIADAKITDIDGDRFNIEIEGYKRKFELKSNAKYTSQEWINLINIVIEENTQIKKPIINTIKLNQYFKNDLITEQDFIQNIESGDILLFETNNIAAKFQRKLTGSKYDHVALCVRMQDEIRIFDSSSDEGVALSEWKEYIYLNDLYEKVTVRKLQNIDRGQIEQALYTFILENIGKSYSFNFKKLISYYPKSNRDAQGREKDPNEYFCSELVAKFFKNVNLLPQDKAASSYWPISFSQMKNLQLLNGASFGDEITIVLDRHRNLVKERKKEVRSLSSMAENY